MERRQKGSKSEIRTGWRAIFVGLLLIPPNAYWIASGEATSTQTISPEPAFKAFSESQAQGIDRMIMCPVCPAETIDQAQVEISRQMRVMVRGLLVYQITASA